MYWLPIDLVLFLVLSGEFEYIFLHNVGFYLGLGHVIDYIRKNTAAQ